MKCENGKCEFKEAFKSKYGVENPGLVPAVREKVETTCTERYGKKSYMGTLTFKDQSKATCLKKYGVEHSSLCPEIQQKMHFRYFYDDQHFDSAPELAFYIWLKDNDKDFEYQPDADCWYLLEGKRHKYCPDFQIEGQLVELKGDLFLKEDGTWQNPYDHSLDALYEAKHQCALTNNVKILYREDYRKYLDYIELKYGKDYLMSFKLWVGR